MNMKLKILLVDDEADVRSAVTMMLEFLNLEVTAVDSCDSAVEALASDSTIGAVMTDWNMPHKDGLEVVKSVRRRSSNIPVILYSGRLDEVEHVAKGFGANVCLAKPFTMEDLQEVLNEAGIDCDALATH